MMDRESEILRRQIEKVDRQIASEAKFSALAQSEFGKFLRERIEDEIALIRRAYAAIPPAAPEASIQLAGLQAAEDTWQRWLRWLEQPESIAADLEAEREELLERLKLQQQTVAERPVEEYTEVKDG